ncbi:EPT1 [Lepeophtheirus salmonis]|uniref:EPT1 n=1 Tax=Lepeophtheirus salmonis TaxID=72036 RepID=A0A7R8HCW4_LEPSM|nr:EPT1 [Lepeophtheirus salmonis]CAF3009924.1 EPT1 [Lepeophtheirus salmonis]
MTIEAHLFKALLTTCLIQSRETSNYHRCGRTDKGVSAFRQVISIDVRTNLKEGIGVFDYPDCKADSRPDMPHEIDYIKIINSNLPPDIQLIAWTPAQNRELSARFDCKKRTYKYFFPFGLHQKNFCKMDVSNGVLTYIRRMVNVSTSVLEPSKEKESSPYDLCVLKVEGNAFLWHQIRCIVTVLFHIGQGREEPELIDELLDIEKNPCRPQYGLASEIPLNLFDCSYEGLTWDYNLESLRTCIKGFQELWAEHAIKAQMIKACLDELESHFDERVIEQASAELGVECHFLRVYSQDSCQKRKKNSTRSKGYLEVEYLNEEALKGFQSYKYNSVDTSPLSNYVMHPFWNWVVDKLCPKWIAPNLLTLSGFICCVAHYLVLSYYDYDFANPLDIARWAWLAASILLFLSHTLDGIDGKQARRTGTSGPLGELFDHGLDSWSTTFITTSLYALFGNDPISSISTARMYFALWAVFLNFQISHFEKYNTGIMYLPWGYDVSMRSSFILEVDGTGKNRPFKEAIRPLVSFFTAFIVCVSWITFFFPTALNEDPRCFYYMTGVLYSNIACRLIVAQMSNTRVELINALIIPTFVSLILVSLLPQKGHIPLLYLLTILLTVAHIHYGVCVVRQLCEYFDIQCFKIKNRSDTDDQQRQVQAVDKRR